jgi:hypothetical protein
MANVIEAPAEHTIDERDTALGGLWSDAQLDRPLCTALQREREHQAGS